VIASDSWPRPGSQTGGTVLQLRKHTVGRLLAINPVDARSREFTLLKPQSSIGSGDSNDLVVRDPTVSKQHAILSRRRRRWELVDTNSSNGTFVGSIRITDKPASLADGQEISFGGAKFVFRQTALAASHREDRPLPPPRGKSAFSLRTASEFVILAFVIGFAAMQYLSYLNYRSTREHAVSTSTKPAGHSP
jgi:pSer/pThr/pTyr-binding forkhead associated (FHA) protein